MNFSKRIALRAGFAALAATLMATCLVMSARADGIASSFSGSSNPNGPWSYGQYVESTQTFTLLTATNSTACDLPNWSGSPGGFPVVVGNNTGLSVTCGTWTLPTDTLNMHPTDTGGTDSDVRWTAPAAGTYVISGSYSALDSTTTLDSILVNGASVFSTNIDSTNTSAAFSLTETLSAGATIDFTVNCCSGSDQNYNSDSTGLTGTINSSSAVTPEPSSLVLLGTGLVGLVRLIRRKVATV